MHMKVFLRWISLLLCLVAQAVMAEAPSPGDLLPTEALRAFDAPQWAGYTVMAASGYGGNAAFAAQYAVVLRGETRNVLCIVEKPPDATAYSITLETDKALYQGDAIPSLLIDTGGDVLFYTYRHEGGDLLAETCSCFKQDGEWGPVNIMRQYAAPDGALREVEFFATAHGYARQTYRFDANENMLSLAGPETLGDPGIPAALSLFDIEAFSTWLRTLDAKG